MEEEPDFEPFQPQGKGTGKEEKVVNHSNDFLELNRRIKVLEDIMSNLRRKILVNEQNDLSRNKKILFEQKSTLTEMNELKKEIENIKRGINEIINELKNSAKREDVEILKKYVDMWNPINFVTEDTVEKIIDEKLSKKAISK